MMVWCSTSHILAQQGNQREVGLQATEVDIERAFWDVVEEGEEPVEVMYGADLDTSRLGSGFPTGSADSSLPNGQHTADGEQLTEDGQPHAQYSDSPWNLNNLPRLEGSLLRHLEDNIAGVTLPWMYMGMMFSSFCWHIEDHMFYSSEPIPGSAAGSVLG